MYKFGDTRLVPAREKFEFYFANPPRRGNFLNFSSPGCFSSYISPFRQGLVPQHTVLKPIVPDGIKVANPTRQRGVKRITLSKICFCVDPVSKTFLKVYCTSFSLNPHVKKARDDSGGVSWTVFSSMTRMQFSSLSLFGGRTRQKTDTSSALLLSVELEVDWKDNRMRIKFMSEKRDVKLS